MSQSIACRRARGARAQLPRLRTLALRLSRGAPCSEHHGICDTADLASGDPPKTGRLRVLVQSVPLAERLEHAVLEEHLVFENGVRWRWSCGRTHVLRGRARRAVC